jgi:23S rRNA (adenine2503-C2)-methyltransferase
MLTAEKIIEKIRKNYFSGFDSSFPEIIQTRRSHSATVKHLMEYSDGTRIESVIMPFHKRHTVCLSSQSGCAMGCRFCETGSSGLVRSLNAEEIIAQYLACYRWIIDDLKIRNVPKPHIVFMGEGEPLHNFNSVKGACEIFLSPEGVYIGPRQITVSTAGYLPGLERFNELYGVNIAFSLHSAMSEKREELIPLEKKYSLEKLLEALDTIKLMRNQYINFEYLLIDGFNDSDEDVQALCKITRRYRSIVNIIPLNNSEASIWQPPRDEAVTSFKEKLVFRGIRTMVRDSKGKDINAACGQLKGSASSKHAASPAIIN